MAADAIQVLKTVDQCHIQDIQQTIDLNDPYPSVTDRYFETRFWADDSGADEDMRVLFHSNRICVVTLAPSHPILRDQLKVIRVDFQVKGDKNRLENKVSGKAKRGAQLLEENSRLCFIHCEGDKQYLVRSRVRGKLVEVNEKLVNHPELLTEKPESDGFIAIALPKLGESDAQKKQLLNHEDYESVIALRRLHTPS